MAGIGFELRRLVGSKAGILGTLRAYSSAGSIAAGPWVLTVTTLALVSIGGRCFGNSTDFDQFRALVTYAFAFSLLTVGTVQMALTRRVADLLYLNQHDKLFPALVASIVLVAVVQSLSAARKATSSALSGTCPTDICAGIGINIVALVSTALSSHPISRGPDKSRRAGRCRDRESRWRSMLLQCQK
jgi:hypothetical protein